MPSAIAERVELQVREARLWAGFRGVTTGGDGFLMAHMAYGRAKALFAAGLVLVRMDGWRISRELPLGEFAGSIAYRVRITVSSPEGTYSRYLTHGRVESEFPRHAGYWPLRAAKGLARQWIDGLIISHDATAIVVVEPMRRS